MEADDLELFYADNSVKIDKVVLRKRDHFERLLGLSMPEEIKKWNLRDETKSSVDASLANISDMWFDF
jgi:hypothetical protein